MIPATIAIISVSLVLFFVIQHRLLSKSFILPAALDLLLIFSSFYLVQHYSDLYFNTFRSGIAATVLGVVSACAYHIGLRPRLYVVGLHSDRLKGIEMAVLRRYGVKIKVYQSNSRFNVEALPGKKVLVVSESAIDGLEIKDIANVALVKSLRCRCYSVLLFGSLLIPILLFYLATSIKEYSAIFWLAGGSMMVLQADLFGRINSTLAAKRLSGKMCKEELLSSVRWYYHLLNLGCSGIQKRRNNQDKQEVVRVISSV